MQSTSPFKYELLDNQNKPMTMSSTDANDLPKNYFDIDSNHDRTSGGSPAEDKAIIRAIQLYPERFNDIKFMLIDDALFKRMVDPKDKTTNYDGQVNQVTLAGKQPDTTFQEFIKNVLNIDLGTIPDAGGPGSNPILKSCTIGRMALYQYLKFFNIYDMGPQFPDKISSPSFIIDSASAVNDIESVPNICLPIDHNLEQFSLPGSVPYKDQNNQNLSFLFYGDLQIADYYHADLKLDLIVNNASNGMNINPNVFAFFPNDGSVPGNPVPLEQVRKLTYYSIIALNIFWQNVLSYVKVYTDLHDQKNGNTEIGYALKMLRHWVFTHVEMDDTKPKFKGKFIKTITNADTNITYIPYWFLWMHDGLSGPPFVVGDMLDTTYTCQMNVSQPNCAKLINEICVKYDEPKIAHPRSKGNNDENICEAIRESFNYAAKRTFAQDKYIVYMCQILKFTGDKSHQTIAELLNVVFKSRPRFKQMTGCVNTIDRPLIVGCIMDNRPFISPETSSQIMRSMGLPYTSDALESAKQKLVAFYIPKLEMDIFGRLEQKYNAILQYRNMLLQLYDTNPASVSFYNDLSGHREQKAKEIAKTIYNTMTYIALFYLSFFSFEIAVIDFIRKMDDTPIVTLPGEGMYYTRAVGGRIHGATIAYILCNDDTLKLDTSMLRFPKLAGFDNPNLEGMPTPVYPPFALSNKTFLTQLTLAFYTFPYKLDKSKVLTPQFSQILNSYLYIKRMRFDYTENLEMLFMKDLEMYEFMGGKTTDPVLNSKNAIFVAPHVLGNTMPVDDTIEYYYKKYPIVDFKAPSGDLITLCELHKKQDKIVEGGRGVHASLFTDVPTFMPAARPLDPNNYYDNIFMYNQQYTGDGLVDVNEYIPLLNGLCNNHFASANQFKNVGYLSFTLFQIQDFGGTYYMFPSGTIPATYKTVFADKSSAPLTENLVIKNLNHEVVGSLNYEMIFKRLTQYINDVSFLMEVEFDMVNPVRPKVKTICFGVQCKLAVFLALLFFRHKSTVLQLKKLATLLNKGVFVKPPQIPLAPGAIPPRNDPGRKYYDPHAIIDATILDNTEVQVLGVFSITAEGSGNFISYDMTQLDGRYYIYKKHLQESYIELKKALMNFLEKCDDIFKTDNEYSNIILA